MTRTFVLWLCTVAALANVFQPAHATGVPPPDQRAIVFSRTGNQASNGVYLIAPDGTGETEISPEVQPSQIRTFQNRGEVYEPTWSPDHTLVAFSGHGADGFDHLYVARPNGSLVSETATTQGFGDVGASWAGSDDLVAMEHHGDERAWIRAARTDANVYQRVTKSVGFDPEASPDGGTIAFRSKTGALFTIGIDGKARARVTRHPVTEFVWSPDGTRIAYVSSADGDDEIFTAKPDGDGKRQLTDNAGDDREPDWSPDSSHIAFAVGADGARDVFTVARNGSSLTQLTVSPGDDFDPTWSPDGEQLAFVSNRDANDEIYVMDSDGTQQSRVTLNVLNDREPDW
ncbi:MAG: LpqB family beta-propeller domain-containing protein [Actinomycetota bacterium]|nr:LpqB family beta-propeller domain-containing protein [Actinomycetota bacterium]